MRFGIAYDYSVTQFKRGSSLFSMNSLSDGELSVDSYDKGVLSLFCLLITGWFFKPGSGGFAWRGAEGHVTRIHKICTRFCVRHFGSIEPAKQEKINRKI